MRSDNAMTRADAVLSVMPLDDFVAEAALRMEVAGDPTTEQPIFEFRRIIADREGTRFLPRRFGTVRVLRARMERLRSSPLARHASTATSS
jgi:hypothetical protein